MARDFVMAIEFVGGRLDGEEQFIPLTDSGHLPQEWLMPLPPALIALDPGPITPYPPRRRCEVYALKRDARGRPHYVLQDRQE